MERGFLSVFYSLFIRGLLALFRLWWFPHRAEEMDFPLNILLFSAFLGGSEAGFQFPQFVLAMITAFQFTAALNHWIFP